MSATHDIGWHYSTGAGESKMVSFTSLTSAGETPSSGAWLGLLGFFSSRGLHPISGALVLFHMSSVSMRCLIYQDLFSLDLSLQQYSANSAHGEFSSEQNQELQGTFRVGLRNLKFSFMPNVSSGQSKSQE